MPKFDSVRFPLPRDKVPVVHPTETDVKYYRALAADVVQKTVEQEREYRYALDQQLDASKWKYIKGRRDLHAYKRLSAEGDSQVETSKYVMVPMVLAVGSVEGTLENTLYGLHCKTTDEMRTMASCTNKNLLDTAVLATLESGTDEDPHRFLSLKWRVAHTPGGSLIKNRDVTNLEFMGTDVDQYGEKYAFHMLKSIDLPGFPEFTNSDCIRARMMLCCIFRQIAPNVVGAFCKGVFNLGGALLDVLAYNTAADTVLAISKAIDCANMKRLTTLMLIKNGTADRAGAAFLSENGKESIAVDDRSCHLCRRRGMRSKLGLRCRACAVCAQATCSKCYVKRKVLASPKNFHVVCCTACGIDAKTLRVDPRDPYPLIKSGPEHY